MFLQGRYALTSDWSEYLIEWAGPQISPDVFPFAAPASRYRRKSKLVCQPEWGKKANGGFNLPWGGENLFLMPPSGDLHRMVEKVQWEWGRGIAVVPVLKNEPWFWSLGEIAIDWWDLPISQKNLVDEWGKTHRTGPWKMRAVIFDSLGQH